MTTVWLEVHDALRSRRVPVVAEPFTLGRDGSNDLAIPCSEVSRRHAVIRFQGDRILIQDRDSKYGTHVNGSRIVTHELAPGDLIHLGAAHGTDVVFLGPQPASATEAETVTGTGEVRIVGALLEGLRALGTARVLEEVLVLVLDAALDLSEAERGFIMLLDESGRLETTVGRGRDRHMLPTTELTSRRIPEQVLATGEPCLEVDLGREGIRSEHLDTQLRGIRSVLCLPLLRMRYLERSADERREPPIGVLYLDGKARGRLVSEATQAALRALGAEAGVAIENARLYRDHCERERLAQELALAAGIQRELLPESTCDRPSFALAATTLPCRAIGGDAFDYEVLDDGRLAFWLGDVAGKGPPAALLSARVQGILAVQSDGDGVAAMMAQVNDTLVRRAVRARFVTLFYGRLGSDGRLSYCNAGHNPPFVLGRSGARRLDVGGPVLGMFPGLTYEEGSVPLEAGDWIIVYSDGVTEASSPCGEEFGDVRLLEVAEAHRAKAPAGLVGAIVDHVREFMASVPQADDVTVLAVQYRGIP